MTLNKNQQETIQEILRETLRLKLKNYTPESDHKPFHNLLIGADRMALFSFIQSLNTSFGQSIFESIAAALAMPHYKRVEKQVQIGNTISRQSQVEIQDLMNKLSTAEIRPNKTQETQRLHESSQVGGLETLKPTRVDLFLENHDGEIFLFDLKTVKPNSGEAKGFKRTLLEWIAIVLATKPNAIVYSAIALPYNPYHPKPYARWTMTGMLDSREIYVAEEFWDFLGGTGSYEALLNIFEQIGKEMRPEIDKRFSQFT